MKMVNLLFNKGLEAALDDAPYNLKEFVCNKSSKKLRPKLIFACLNALGERILPEHILVAHAIEILHSATLIHDDIIDESPERRGSVSFYKKFGAKKSVILGDYLLSVAVGIVSEVGSPGVLKIFSTNMRQICAGELMDIGNHAKVDDYIEKITKKTALLFLCGVSSALELCEIPPKIREKIENFALNFGIAFQIKDDIDDGENVCDTMGKSYVDYIKRAKADIEFLDETKQQELLGFLDNLQGLK